VYSIYYSLKQEELEAEMKALESIKSDRQQRQKNATTTTTANNKVFVNNKAGLKTSLEDFQWTNKAKWFDHLVIVGENREDTLESVDDDLTRETFFYERALESANVAVKKLKKLGVPVKRPDDYYAEMVKSDEHMKRVRSELMYEQQQLEVRDERRKTREAKRYGKQVQAEKVKQRTLAKKEQIKDLDKWRSQRKKSGFADDGKAPFEGAGGDGMKRKRETRDSKFGFGGKKRVSKRFIITFYFLSLECCFVFVDFLGGYRGCCPHPLCRRDWSIEHFHGVYSCVNALQRPCGCRRKHFCFRLPYGVSIFHCLGRAASLHLCHGTDHAIHILSSFVFFFVVLFV
jgi:rRNA-processing protein EBP2